MSGMRSILVAVDFSEPSRTAVRLGARLARQCGARLHVLHVEDPLLVAAAEQSGMTITAQVRTELQQLVAGIAEASPLSPCIDVVVDGPAHGILAIAERENADLIVMARHGMSKLKKVLFGSVTQQVLLRSTRSVLVVPDEWTLPSDVDDIGLGPIIVGIDGTCSAILAGRAANDLARMLGTTVTGIHVVPGLTVLERWQSHADRAIAERVELAKRDIGQLVSLTIPQLSGVDVKVGDVAEQLAHATAVTDARRPLLMLGRREPGTLNDIPGAIAERAAALVDVPVLMFRERAA